jgi:hypothetical protein
MVSGEESWARVDVTSTATSGLGAAENLLQTWNTRDAETWAESLKFPHTVPPLAHIEKGRVKLTTLPRLTICVLSPLVRITQSSRL